METRKERYRRYREEIKQMRDDAFPNAPIKRLRSLSEQDLEILERAERASSAISFGDILQSAEGKEAPAFTKKRVSPYHAYQKRRWIGIGIKTLALLVTIALFLIWYFSIAARS